MIESVKNSPCNGGIVWASLPGVAGDMYVAEQAGGMWRVWYRCCDSGTWIHAGLIPVRICRYHGVHEGQDADHVSAGLAAFGAWLRENMPA